ncbi:MAG: cell division protein SepF [Actinomycetota bacterium]|nr:cell division protein SepF [Actinomycetota bacterium]
MSGILRKTFAFLGFSDPDEYEEEHSLDEENNDEYDVKEKYYGSRIGSSRAKRKVSFLTGVKPEPKSRVFIAEPHNFEDMQVIGQNFKSAIPVIINLQNTNTELSKRIIDFCSGLSFALEGNIQKVADRVFLITPYNVEVTSKDRELLKEKGLFNQF